MLEVLKGQKKKQKKKPSVERENLKRISSKVKWRQEIRRTVACAAESLYYHCLMYMYSLSSLDDLSAGSRILIVLLMMNVVGMGILGSITTILTWS